MAWRGPNGILDRIEDSRDDDDSSDSGGSTEDSSESSDSSSSDAPRDDRSSAGGGLSPGPSADPVSPTPGPEPGSEPQPEPEPDPVDSSPGRSGGFTPAPDVAPSAPDPEPNTPVEKELEGEKTPGSDPGTPRQNTDPDAPAETRQPETQPVGDAGTETGDPIAGQGVELYGGENRRRARKFERQVSEETGVDREGIYITERDGTLQANFNVGGREQVIAQQLSKETDGAVGDRELRITEDSTVELTESGRDTLRAKQTPRANQSQSLSTTGLGTTTGTGPTLSE